MNGAAPGVPAARRVELSKGWASLEDAGRGPAVVCVHGLPGSGRDFRWLVPHLADRARVVCVDLPGFGSTPVATGEAASPEGRADFVLELVDALGLDRPVLVGHSMGGVVAVAAVARSPFRFRGLGLLSTPGLRPHAAFRRLPRTAMHLALGSPWAPLLLPLARRLFAAAGFRHYPDAALVRTVACLRFTSLEAHAQRLRGLALPTLAAWCEDDPLIEPDILSELASALPPGPRLRFASGGHVPQKAHAAEVAEGLWTLAAQAGG